jgi:leucine dehydrogenase
MTASLAHEELHVGRGERSGLCVIVAIHSTALGPALGGARLWHYGTPGDGIADALRLSEAMTLKAAAAGLRLGGGKCVLCAEGELGSRRRRELMLDLGDTIESLDGRYITAEDVGTGPEDMVSIAERTDHVTGLPPELGGSGDPSPVTARGVEAAIRAALLDRHGDPSPNGRRVCVIGLGHVGLSLADRLAEAGAELVVTDVDHGKRAAAASLGARWVEPDEAIGAECDVLAPCAMGGTIGRSNVGRLRCAIVCGSANNVLADPEAATAMAEREILYVPDFIANSGGLINVYAELHGLEEEQIGELVEGIGDSVAGIIAEARREGTPPLAAARALARRRLSGAGRDASPAKLSA